MRVAVLGAGSWGSVLAALLVEQGHDVALWGRDPAAVRQMVAGRQNARYLPGCPLPPGIRPAATVAEAAVDREVLVFALPTGSVREVARVATTTAGKGALLVCASKGLEEISRLTLDRVLGETLPGRSVVLFSGPTFAAEVGRRLPAAAVAASTDAAAAEVVQRVFACDRFRVYTTEDVVGVAIGGALKNVVAIAAGCSDGLGFGANARAALITRGLHEMGRLAVRLGGNPLTLAGLAGLGDLVLTCTGDLSRNRRVGVMLAAGDPLASIVARLGQVAEGVYTARIGADLARELGVEMPITTRVAEVLSGSITPSIAVSELLARERGPERG
jgi:glycerol-3-phosphate dehydrogenase (NAD(P)+)